ncbi:MULTISPECIES: WhiB family transcriptional regulator [unclassified Dietzia]|uniref:WhiB family transcriptional regulator n=1 Tax=unclassified Dietzia TaxID=2617939 RepID=UPI000D21613F|nr:MULTISPECIES: WhiB family transcriptional regulator [unclassified Dietzia]AVZ38605.1 WhiB family transcriptional regulator [Dietzia sp. JS16-p6b]MBB1025809.1 WhiB family transcriptional regulator [Dietzia sp. DQ12-76]MBB1028098.1 WhiB family transcriptional regulator [Dietzia sp. DQ11-38-2]QGW23682.1 transcription factor WhiB [Dietzia sp. DQ12-45-1b]
MTIAAARIIERWAWAEHGLCRDVPDLFYNADDDPKGLRRRKEAAATKLCGQCPVIRQCRAHAVGNRELYGVWGGMTEAERHRLAGRARTG